MEGLRECPFCGARWREKEHGVFILWHNPTCVFGGPSGVVHSTAMDDVFINRWNARTTDPLMDEMARALERYVDEYEQWEYAVECVTGKFPNTDIHLDQARKVLQKYREATNGR